MGTDMDIMLAKRAGHAVLIGLFVFTSSNLLANEELRSALEAAVEKANQAEIASEIEKSVVKQEGHSTATEKSKPPISVRNELENVVSEAIATGTPKSTKSSVEGSEGAKGEADSKTQVPEVSSTKEANVKEKRVRKEASDDVPQKVAETVLANRVVARTNSSSSASRKPIRNVDNNKKHEGWMYIGRFFDENWTDKALKIDNKLPKSGEEYKVGISTNVRASYPGQQGMKKVVKVLDDRYRVEVINVRRVGRDHHYWALVKWLK